MFLWQVLPMKLDRIDQSILAELQREGRLSNRDLADRVHLSESACLRRVRALEEARVIDRYIAVVNQAKVGLPGNVFVSITLNRQEQADLAAFGRPSRGYRKSWSVTS